MLAVILPTSEIINHYERHNETLFSFLTGGVAEVVRRLVLVSSGWYFDHYSDLQRSDASVEVTNEIVEMYEASMWRRYLENTHSKLNVMEFIESVIREIETDINAMMYSYFLNVPYQVHDSAGWLGKELVVHMSPVRGYHGSHPTPNHYSLF